MLRDSSKGNGGFGRVFCVTVNVYRDTVSRMHSMKIRMRKWATLEKEGSSTSSVI